MTLSEERRIQSFLKPWCVWQWEILILAIELELGRKLTAEEKRDVLGYK